MLEDPDEVIAPDNSEEIQVAEVMQQIQIGVRQRQAELAAWGDRARIQGGEQFEQRLRELQDKAHIKERPFVSHLPIIGRFVAFFRETWNSVATKWYVRPMLHQQNIFNQTVTQVIREYLETQSDTNSQLRGQLDELDQRAIGGDRDVTLLARKIAEWEYRVRQLECEVSEEQAALTHRLAELEKMVAAAHDQGAGE